MHTKDDVKNKRDSFPVYTQTIKLSFLEKSSPRKEFSKRSLVDQRPSRLGKTCGQGLKQQKHVCIFLVCVCVSVNSEYACGVNWKVQDDAYYVI